jgi:diguanylate cyclase (GGDEF)-like protein
MPITVILAIGLAAAGTAAVLLTERGGVLAPVRPIAPTVAFLLLVTLFAAAELALLHVELRHQAHSFSLSGVALLLGVLYFDLRLVVVARLVGAGLAFSRQRLSSVKRVYNLCAYLLESGIIGLCLHQVLRSRAELDLSTATACFLIVALVDLMMSSLVLLVISIHQDRVTGSQVVAVMGPASVLSLFSTLSALAVAALLTDGRLGLVLILGFASVTAVLYQSYLSLRHRHQSLALMHDFVEQSVSAATLEELADLLLARARRLLNAGEVVLVVYRSEGDLHLRVAEDEALSIVRWPPIGPGDWLLTRACTDLESIAIPRTTRDPGMRQWLVDHAAKDALIVPLSSEGVQGVVIAQNRMGQATTFTADDLALLRTLAGHLGVALRGIRLVEQLRFDATHDTLTGLPNRVLLTERIEQDLNRPGAPSTDVLCSRTAVLLLDLDRFKEVNDALGHHVGDALLRVVGARIRTCVPEGGTAARLGGDEFAILLPFATAGPAGPGGLLAVAERTAKAVLAELTSPVVLAEAVVSTQASVGIALASTGMSGADLLRHADTAMYTAKAGEGSIVVYSEELDHGRVERLTLLADLALALERGELEVRYQPQLDLRTNEVASVEALVRWRHPRRGLLDPDKFIALAESGGLIGELTRQVLRQALRQCRRWHDAGLDLVVAVNLSAHSVNDTSLAENVAAALAEAGVSADHLVMEITESSVMGEPSRTVPILQRLADIGVTISLDDFGTGYSSLAYLQKLPVREVKIDRSFITGLSGEAPASSVLIRSILTLGANLGLRVVAEGVEDAEVLEFLRGLGCDLAQGYFIARAVPAADVGDLGAGRLKRVVLNPA